MKKKLYKFVPQRDKNRFLNYLVDCGTISKAAKAMGISRQTHYLWLHSDSNYAIAFNRARAMANDLLEEAAYRRAVEGCERGIYYKGDRIATRIEYSDTLLAMLLKGAFPDKYKARVQLETVGDGAAELAWEGDDDDGDDDSTEETDHDTVPARAALEKDHPSGT